MCSLAFCLVGKAPFRAANALFTQRANTLSERGSARATSCAAFANRKEPLKNEDGGWSVMEPVRNPLHAAPAGATPGFGSRTLPP